MSVAKIIELVGSSTESWEDAVRSAVAEASRTLRGVRGVDVQDWTAKVEDGEIVEYKANVKIAFGIESDEEGDETRKRTMTKAKTRSRERGR